MYTLTGVSKTYTKRSGTVLAVRDVMLVDSRRRVAGHPGPHRQRQDHPAATARLPCTAPTEAGGGASAAGARPGCAEPELSGVRASTIGFVFQTFNLIPTLSSAGRASEAALGAGRKGRAAGCAAAGARPRRPGQPVGSPDRANHLPSELSGGQRRQGGHRPGPGQGTKGAARRRAHRQPRHRHPRRDHGHCLRRCGGENAASPWC